LRKRERQASKRMEQGERQEASKNKQPNQANPKPHVLAKKGKKNAKRKDLC
jgi:hypothetical protein